MLRIVVVAFALAVCSGPVMAEKATGQQAKKGHSFEECQARARATGNKWMGTNGRHFSNPSSVMRNHTPLVPGAFDVTVHSVLNYFGSRLGRAYAETGEDEADENTVIENILGGQYSDPIRVVAFNTAEGWAEDVTEDIAIAVLSRARSEHCLIGKVTQGFVERALGAEVFMGD